MPPIRIWVRGDHWNLTAANDLEARMAANAAPPLLNRLQQAMAEDARNVSFLVIGDSTSSYATGSDTFKWPYLILNALAARYPKYTVAHQTWNGNGFQATGTVQTGTGGNGNTLTLYNASWGGVGPRFHQTSAFNIMMFSAAYDAVFFSHGHNDGSGFTADPFFKDDLLALTESVNRARPGAEIILIAQNPRAPVPASDYQRNIAMQISKIAQMKGYSWVNVWKAFQNASPGGVTVVDPAAGALLISDGVHPNTAGQIVWANTIINRMNLIPGFAPSQHESSFAVPTLNRLANGDFASFASPPTLPSWTATNAVLSKDTTNFESPSGYAVKITPSSAAASYISQAVASMTEYKGRMWNVAARIWVAGSVKTASTTSARVSIVETGGATPGETLSTASANGTDNFLWITTTRFIASNATGMSIRVYGDSGAVSGSIVTVDRVVLSSGELPRDVR